MCPSSISFLPLSLTKLRLTGKTTLLLRRANSLNEVKKKTGAGRFTETMEPDLHTRTVAGRGRNGLAGLTAEMSWPDDPPPTSTAQNP